RARRAARRERRRGAPGGRARRQARTGRPTGHLPHRPRPGGAAPGAGDAMSDASAEAPGRSQGWAPGAGTPSSWPAAARSRGRAGAAAVSATQVRRGLLALLLVGVTYATMIQSFSWNQTSHYDLIRSLDKGGTTIDAYQENTGDKVLYHHHWFSARAPGLAL